MTIISEYIALVRLIENKIEEWQGLNSIPANTIFLHKRDIDTLIEGAREMVNNIDLAPPYFFNGIQIVEGCHKERVLLVRRFTGGEVCLTF